MAESQHSKKEKHLKRNYIWVFLVLVTVGVLTLSGCAGWETTSGGDHSNHSSGGGGYHH